MTVVEGDQKGLFSIATTPRCWVGCYSLGCSTLPLIPNVLSLWYDST